MTNTEFINTVAFFCLQTYNFVMGIKETTKTNVKVIMMAGLLLLLFLVFGLAVIIILNHFKAYYLIDASIATVSLTIAVLLPFRQKSISFQSIFLLVIAILFVASGTFQYTDDNLIGRLPILQQIEFSKSIRLNQVSSGFANAGIGIAWLLLGIIPAKFKSPTGEKRKKLWIMFRIGVGILWLLLGISSIFNGLRHL